MVFWVFLVDSSNKYNKEYLINDGEWKLLIKQKKVPASICFITNLVNDVSQYFLFLFTLVCTSTTLFSEIISVGSGSYTTSFPGLDEAGRNSFPSGEPQVSGPALNKKIQLMIGGQM